MKRNMKITIASMAVLLVMAIAATIASFSMADEPAREVEPLAAANDDVLVVERATNVDYIIMNANNTEADDMVYHVVEIGSGAQGKFQEFFNDGNFAKYVLDGNKSASNDLSMDATKIEYNYFNASSVGETDTSKLQTIAKADFIYVSNINNAFSTTNDIGEELYNLLHTYAIGDYKPLIIDSPNAGSGGNGGNGGGGNGGGGNSGGSTAPTNATISTVVTDYYAPSGVYNGTYEWNTATPADTFLAGGLNETKYIGVNSKTAQKNWLQLYNEPDAELDEEQKNDSTFLTRAGRLAKILVVSKDGSAGSLAGTLTAGADAVDLTVYYTNSDGVTAAYEGGNTYSATQTLKNIYSSRYSYRPDFVQLDGVAVSAFADADIDGYDMVVIEPDCAGEAISQAAYDRFVAAMKAKMRIVYDSSLNTTGSTQGSGNSGGTTGNDDAGTGSLDDANRTNYHELYYMVATADGIAKYANIMPTSASTVNMMATSKSASICKPIADLINNSSYRGIGGPSSSSTNGFTVLEIQPCYPIDLQIASARNKYYADGANMAPSGMTKEQLGIETPTNNSREYYAWEITEAEIADAFGLDYDEVSVVHMSIEEFAASKTDVLGMYDLVYIGGNRSALKSGEMIYSQDCGDFYTGWTYYSAGEAINMFMFLAEGGEGYRNLQGPWSANPTVPMVDAQKRNPRDLTDKNLRALEAYADANMPIIISKELTNAYNVSGGTVGTSSNMYKFLNKYMNASNVASNFESIVVKSEDASGLGDTLTGYVWIYDDEAKTALLELYARSTKRLSLALTSRPPQYNLYDESTKLSAKSLKFKYDTNDSTATPKLFVDHDGNGAFEADEEVAVKIGDNGVVTHDMSEYEGGLVYWKFSLVNGNSEASTIGATFIKPEEGKKKLVKVLQIIPEDRANKRSYGAQGSVSLLFCTECQRTMNTMKYNAVSNYGAYNEFGVLYEGSDTESRFANETLDANGKISGTDVYMGLHEHKFGIVKYGGSSVYKDKQGTTNEVDDWDWNFAKELEDYYDFHLDIMETREYEALDARIKNSYSSLLGDDAALQTAEKELSAASKAYEACIADGSELDKATKKINEVLDAMSTSAADKGNATMAYNFKRLVDMGNYYEYYSSFPNTEGSGLSRQAAISNDTTYYRDADDNGFYYYYSAWVTENDKRIKLLNEYMEALYKYNYLNNYKNAYKDASGEIAVPEKSKDWLTGSYDTIIIGPSENFAEDDIKSGDDVLKNYANRDQQIILFHETVSRFSNYCAANITNAVYKKAGLYAYSDTQFYGDSSKPNYAPYQYAKLQWNMVSLWSQSSSATTQAGTNRASMNNRCSVNTYPFTLSDQLSITGTHPVGYAIDVNRRDVTALYTLATSTYQNEYQTVYPASPKDGQDNYFIYKAGHVYYCGAGHAKVTGPGKDNNDERRLYINIICASVNSSTEMPIEPSIDVFDYTDGKLDEKGKPVEKNDFVKKNGDDGYIYELDEDDDIPEFSFKVNTDTGVTIQSIDIYYKLDSSFLYETDEEQLKNKLHYSSAKGDKMIVQGLKSTPGAMNDIDADKYAGLKLTQEMFDAYGGNYTYIVIAVTDSAGNTSFQKIKITRKTHLFDLT